MLAGLSVGLLDDFDRNQIKPSKAIVTLLKLTLLWGRVSLWFWTPIIALAIYWLKTISLCFLLKVYKWLIIAGFLYVL